MLDNEGFPSYNELLTSRPDMHPTIREHVERLARGTGELPAAAMAPSEVDATNESTSQDNELETTKSISFVDGRGIERRPNTFAAEIYATEEIKQAVSEHFINVDTEINNISRDLKALLLADERGDGPKPFNPLSEELLRQVLDVSTEQLPNLTHITTGKEPRVIETGRLFKRKKIVNEEVAHEERIPGFTATADNEEDKKAWRQTIVGLLYHPDTHKVEANQLPIYEKAVANRLLEFLTSTELTQSEKHGHGIGEAKLPLLATKLLDSGMKPDQIKSLSWDDVSRLVPEASKMFEDISQATTLQSGLALQTELFNLDSRVWHVSPEGCSTIARLYYDEELLGGLDRLQTKVNSAISRVRQQLYQNHDSTADNNYIERQHQSIASFFDRHLPADTLFIHGTHFGPRIVRSGALKPSQNMTDEEFTFGTNRSRQQDTDTGNSPDGSRGVHWAALGNRNYASNLSRIEAIENLQRLLSMRYSFRPDLAQKEIEKDGIGEARFTIRFGDLISITPYPDTDYDSYRKERPVPRLGVVELTESGWNRIADRLGTNGPNDTAYSAAPDFHDLDEVYGYQYPLDMMLIGVPSRDPDTIKDALREKGWTDQQIAEHTYAYEEITGDAEAAIPPKYPHKVVVPISEEL